MGSDREPSRNTRAELLAPPRRTEPRTPRAILLTRVSTSETTEVGDDTKLRMY
jgi:hypothetical protein